MNRLLSVLSMRVMLALCLVVANLSAMNNSVYDENFDGRICIQSTPRGVSCDIQLDEDCFVTVDIDKNSFSKEKVFESLKAALDGVSNEISVERFQTYEWLNRRAENIHTMLTDVLQTQ